MKGAAVLLALSAAGASAHPLPPASLQISEIARGRYDVVWKRDGGLEPRFPARCHAGARESHAEPGVQRFQLDCGGESFAGEPISVEGAFALNPEVVLTFHGLDGQTAWAVLREQAPSSTIGAAPLRQLLPQPEPLLFLLALCLLIPARRALLQAALAFVAARALAGFLPLPQAFAQAASAAALVLLAAELARVPRAPWPRPWTVALVCGFCQRAALPAGAGPAAALLVSSVALLGVAACAPLLRRLVAARMLSLPLGALAAFVCIERVASWWT